MLQLKRNRSAFTLIELLVVVIIVAILAAVSVPILSANTARARATEAETALGTIRTVMRADKAENSQYDTTIVATTLATAAFPAEFTAGDLDGKFYDEAAYIFSEDTGIATFCVGILSPATGRPARSIDETGTLFEDEKCTAGKELN